MFNPMIPLVCARLVTTEILVISRGKNKENFQIVRDCVVLKTK